jgi:hypothetical protein
MLYHEENYTLTQALEDGTLLDVSDLARKAGCPCPTYITAAAWTYDEIACNEEQVIAAMKSEDLHYLSDFLYSQDIKTLYKRLDRFGSGTNIRVYLDVSFDKAEPFPATIYIYKSGEAVDFRVPRSAAGGSFYAM